jgi:hypothetical protein
MGVKGVKTAKQLSINVFVPTPVNVIFLINSATYGFDVNLIIELFAYDEYWNRLDNIILSALIE